jgi:hypothetical protein
MFEMIIGMASRRRLSEIDPSVSGVSARTGLTILVRARTTTPAHEVQSA